MTGKISLSKDAHKVITEFIQAQVRSAQAEGVVLGLSGGLDSSVVAKLSADAIGKNKVLGIMMPAADSPEDDLAHADLVAKKFGIRSDILPITAMVNAFKKELEPNKRELGNIKARCRMTTLHQRAMRTGYLVAGTGNKSELLVGYFTKYGDGGVDILPIGDLYKTQVRQMARELGVPEEVLKKPPSASLWAGQTDEGELGMTYERLDSILYCIERGLAMEDIHKETGVPKKDIVRVERMVESTKHKRKMPPIPKLGVRTIGLDWRE